MRDSFCHVRTQGEVGTSQTRTGSSPEPNPDLRLPGSTAVRNKCVTSYPAYSIRFQQPEQTKTVRQHCAEGRGPLATGNESQLVLEQPGSPLTGVGSGTGCDSVLVTSCNGRKSHSVTKATEGECHEGNSSFRQKHDLPQVIEEVSKIIEYMLKGLLSSIYLNYTV